MTQPLLEIKDLQVSVGGENEESGELTKESSILRGVNLTINEGEVHVIMGPNGSGKSTLAYVLMGHPQYNLIGGDIIFRGKSIIEMPPDERARMGLFLSFQYPTAIPGVTVSNFLRNMLKNAEKNYSIKEFRSILNKEMESLEINPEFIVRYVNDGFSGGEKKKNEILQMNLLEPKLIVLDEIDSGLDIDAMRLIAENIEKQRSDQRATLVITHYQRLLTQLTVDHVHVFLDGKIAESGDAALAQKLEEHGYEWVRG